MKWVVLGPYARNNCFLQERLTLYIEPYFCSYYMQLTVDSHVRTHCLKLVKPSTRRPEAVQTVDTWIRSAARAKNALTDSTASLFRIHEFCRNCHLKPLNRLLLTATYTMVYKSLHAHPCDLKYHRSATLHCRLCNHNADKRLKFAAWFSLCGCCIHLKESSIMRTWFSEHAMTRQWHW